LRRISRTDSIFEREVSALRPHFIFFILMVFGIVPAAISQSTSPEKLRMMQVVQNYVDNKSFMGDVLVAEGNHIALESAYGYADLDWSIPNTIDTKFRIGSLTKQFTAASILLLQERGKLNVNEPVIKYLHNFPEGWSKVTSRNLLTHTSGIPNFTGAPGFNAYELQDHTPDESVALVQGKPLDFEPGTKFYYSNTNYVSPECRMPLSSAGTSSSRRA